MKTLLLLLMLLVVSLWGRPSVQFESVQNEFLRYAVENVSDCHALLKNVTMEEWEYFWTIQNAYSNFTKKPMERLNDVEFLIQRHHNLKGITARNSSLDAYGIFSIYVITDFDRSRQDRVDDLLETMQLSPHKFKTKDFAGLVYTSLVINWDDIGTVIDKTLGKETQKLLQKSFRILNESEEFLRANHEKKGEMALKVLGCFVGTAIKKSVYRDNVSLQ